MTTVAGGGRGGEPRPPDRPGTTGTTGTTGRARRVLGRVVLPVALGLVAADAVLVSTGALGVRSGVVLGTAVEALLWAGALAGGIAVLREARRRRRGGATFLRALEDGLATVLPRRVAHVLLLEPLLWKALVHLATGRSRGRRATTFSYWRQLEGFLVVLAVWSVVELVAVGVVLGVVWGRHWWAWLVVAVHAYGLVLLAGLVASLVTTPHRIEGGELVFADGCLLEGRVRLEDVATVRRVRETAPGFGGRTGLVLSADGRDALVAFGPTASVRVDLVPGARVTWWGREVPDGVRSVTLSADDPQRFVEAVTGAAGDAGRANGSRRDPRPRPEA